MVLFVRKTVGRICRAPKMTKNCWGKFPRHPTPVILLRRASVSVAAWKIFDCAICRNNLVWFWEFFWFFLIFHDFDFLTYFQKLTFKTTELLLARRTCLLSLILDFSSLAIGVRWKPGFRPWRCGLKSWLSHPIRLPWPRSAKNYFVRQNASRTKEADACEYLKIHQPIRNLLWKNQRNPCF